jgi:hypothetical protein
MEDFIGDEIDETLDEWEKGIADLRGNMQKLADALSAGKNKSQQKSKVKNEGSSSTTKR